VVCVVHARGGWIPELGVVCVVCACGGGVVSGAGCDLCAIEETWASPRQKYFPRFGVCFVTSETCRNQSVWDGFCALVWVAQILFGPVMSEMRTSEVSFAWFGCDRCETARRGAISIVGCMSVWRMHAGECFPALGVIGVVYACGGAISIGLGCDLCRICMPRSGFQRVWV
jgi:hypothetical protein